MRKKYLASQLLWLVDLNYEDGKYKYPQRRPSERRAPTGGSSEKITTLKLSNLYLDSQRDDFGNIQKPGKHTVFLHT
jgi:hypothetical protein